MAATLVPSSAPATGLIRLIDEFGRHDHGRTALIDGATGATVTYGDLWRRVRERSDAIGGQDRSLALLVGENSVEYVVTYLALLDLGHVPVPAATDRHLDRLAAVWSPSLVVGCGSDEVSINRSAKPPPEVHRELALLMSTSGSTGSPKLVRLSQRNLLENARSIADALGLTENDCGITSLPLHYSYGLSVLHTHLLVGAGLVVTGGSVVDPCFAEAMTSHGVTNLAGVPHTWDMIERSGPERIAGPTLRLLTQAGGRLAPEAVTRWVERADGWGADFVVMYGQTEATARIACLSSGLAKRRPEAIGSAISGGHLRLSPVEGAPVDTGELVYRGPNVMMGYAVDPADLAGAHEVAELRTGDLARFHADDGVYEIVGRRSRFVKPFGLRVDLDELESQLAAVTDQVAVAGDDDGIRIVSPGAEAAELRFAAAELVGLPENRIDVITDRPIARTRSGKVDHAAIAAIGELGPAGGPGTGDEQAADASDVEAEVSTVFTSVLGGASVRPDDTFVSLGGDSLSYVECSIRLEAALGHLPTDWHLRSISSLAASGVATRPRRRRMARLDTSVLLRAIGICLVVSTHMRLRHIPGGAHLMLGVVGYNVARFITPIDGGFARVKAGLRTLARVAVPTMIWVAVGFVGFGAYGIGTLLLVNNYVGPESHAGSHWHFWFIEVFAHLVLASVVLLAVPAVRRMERRVPYAFALALVAVALVLRLDWSHLDNWYNLRFRTHGIAWFFALGWLVHRSVTMRQRVVTMVIVAISVQGFFHNPTREWLIAAGLMLLVALPTIPFPRIGVRVAGALAAASMWIYISHFTFWPLFDDTLDLRRDIAYALTLAAGLVVWFSAERAIAVVSRGWSSQPFDFGTSLLGLPNKFRSAARTVGERDRIVTTP